MAPLRCLLGIHKWIYCNRKRECILCGHKQVLLPGYGGQEPWCWLPDYKQKREENDNSEREI